MNLYRQIYKSYDQRNEIIGESNISSASKPNSKMAPKFESRRPSEDQTVVTAGRDVEPEEDIECFLHGSPSRYLETEKNTE
jgi:hypothetical protein